MKNIFVIIAVSLVSLLHVQASSNEPLKGHLDALFNGHSFATWSVQIEEKESGKTVYSLAPERRLIPASNEKLVVCAAALLRLGPDFTYNTGFYATSEPSQSVLEGDLIVTGSGDPSLSGRFYGGNAMNLLRQWAQTLKEKGITRIRGNIVGVDSAFDNTPHGLNWHPTDLVEWYAAEVSALSFNDGCIDIQVKGGSKAGDSTTFSLSPPTRYVDILSNVRTVASSKQEGGIVVRREPDQPQIELTGSIRANGMATVYVTIPNPTLFFATVLKETLIAEGIEVSGVARDGDDVQLPERTLWKPLFTHSSKPLINLINVCLKNSQNLYAEHFLKTIGFVDYGVGTWNTGAMAIKDIFFNHGCPLDNLYIADGSGLSRENRLSAQGLVQIIKVMDQSKYADIFYDALPRAGIDGTLKNRMRGTDAYGRVYAKTGTLNGIRALSGMIKAKSGKTYFFSILGNATRQAIQISKIMDDVCALVASQG